MQADAYGRIFLLSHMRALTSLVGHILGSHPQISGYCELHLSYAEACSLDVQRAALAEMSALKPEARYLFDKILHNEYAFASARLGARPLKILVAVQEPEQALRSIAHLFSLKADPAPYASPLAAGRYYVERLHALAEFCRSSPERYFYFDAEAVRKTPGELLDALSGWLELDGPLDVRYGIFSQTGQARRGDSSSRIFSGVIDPQRSDYTDIVLPADVLDEAKAAYRVTREVMVAGADRVVRL